jgi:peptide/nickel transport system substrate-binding protein
MKKAARLVAIVGILAIIAAACGGDDGGGDTTGVTASGTTGATGETGAIPVGGTAKFALVGDVGSGFDPQKEYYSVSFGYFSCCLLRTLFATNGKPVDQGGTDLLPDIAAADPEVSEDGLTWTITLKTGIHYSPPLADVEVTAQDIVRALERTADPKASVGGYSFYYSAIEGFDDFGAGKADSIAGLSTPDDHTLVVTTTSPTGDLGWRFAMPATAPIPPNPDDPSARLGVAEGHTKNYGRFLVASGPYMFEGTDQLDFSLPPDEQQEVSGYVPGRQIVLVRNPSWDPTTDDLRPAYLDRMEASIGGDVSDLYNKVETGDIDYVVDAQPPADILQRYSTDPDLQPYLTTYPINVLSYSSMNLAVPPFDDVHVRKAVNLAYDKEGNRQLAGGPLTGEIAGHIFPNPLISNLLADYDPYPTPENGGDIEAAKAEMALSKYDSDGDGVCDDPSCKDVLTFSSSTDPAPRQAALVAQNLEPLGITLDVKTLETSTMYSKCYTLSNRAPLCLSLAWQQDYPDALTFGPPLFGSESLTPSCCNYNTLGATPEQLKEWGYTVSSVPSVDDRLQACAETIGDARTQCWADFDKYLMEEIVPYIPRRFYNSNETYSPNVVHHEFGEFAGMTSFDHMAVAPSS